jgi:ATP-dependent DNA helicase RecQ
MLDQMRGAKNVIKSDTDNEIFCYYSGCNTQKIKEALHNETARMLFLSPETLTKNEDLRKEILKANKNGYLKNLIVDEAHIIIEWGSSFRVDFQCLDAFQKELLQDNPKLKTYLLSATFSAKTVEDLKKFYRIENKWIELRFDRLRKEPRFNIIKAKSYLDKLDKLKKFVCLLPHPMIIYVNTPDDADKIQKVLNQFGFSNTRTFTGRTNSNEREKLIKDWVDDEFDLMIATCAFGVGVDKKDVRTVIHLYIPSSANQYYQECGRGGRDNLPCLSVMLYTKDDMQSAFKQSQKVLVTEKILGRWFSMLNSDKAQIGVDKTKIDTSVKPSYNENDEFYSYVNNADVAWNVYVILLLRRNGLLNIDRVEYKDDSYIFYVKILDYRIFSNSDETKQIFDDIRENEKNSIYKECNSMHSMLVNIESRCIAELFNDTYKRTEEYCAGCNAHTGVVNEENERRVIMLPLPNPKLRASTEIVELTNGKPEMMIIADGRIFDAVKLLAEKKVDVIVVPPTLSIDVHSLSKDNEILNVMSYVDFFNLSAGENDFYLSGGIAFVLEGDASQWMRLLTVVKRLNCIAVYICNEDLFISGRNKYLSEMINGTRKNLYVIEGE